MEAYRTQNRFLNSEIHQVTKIWRKVAEKEKALLTKVPGANGHIRGLAPPCPLPSPLHFPDPLQPLTPMAALRKVDLAVWSLYQKSLQCWGPDRGSSP